MFNFKFEKMKIKIILQGLHGPVKKNSDMSGRKSNHVEIIFIVMILNSKN